MGEYPPKKQHPLTALALLEVGIFELGFVTIVLILFFGTLNYFNILPVSAVFPQYLGWLPRRDAPNGASQQFNNSTIQQSATPSPANLTPAVFTYDTEKAEALVANYIKNTVKPELLPAKIEVKQGLSIDGRTEDIKYQFGSQFLINKAQVSANFHYKENLNVPNDFLIFIQPENTNETAATASLANSLLASYFTNPFSASNCQTKDTSSYCENFQTLADGKKGYGILLGNDSGKPASIIFTCFIPKESKDYEALKSCITP